MAKFMRKPVIVEAKQFTAKMYEKKGGKSLGITWKQGNIFAEPVIETDQEGVRFKINLGDWIIFPEGGPSYPVHKKEFEKEYVPVEKA